MACALVCTSGAGARPQSWLQVPQATYLVASLSSLSPPPVFVPLEDSDLQNLHVDSLNSQLQQVSDGPCCVQVDVICSTSEHAALSPQLQ